MRVYKEKIFIKNIIKTECFFSLIKKRGKKKLKRGKEKKKKN